MNWDDSSSTPGTIAPSDESLINRVRDGDTAAYAELWDRYVEAALFAARRVVRSEDAEDLVAEAFASILQTINAGKGPRFAFRSYLITAVNNTAIRWNMKATRMPTQQIENLEDTLSEPATLSLATNELLLTVFRELPERWQQVLWFSEVEKMPVTEIGRRMGLSAHSVSTLAYRAREGLRDGWYQAHVSAAPAAEECRETISFLGAFFAQRLSSLRRVRVMEHLAGCASCSAIESDMTHASTELYTVLLPAVGVAGVGGGVAAIAGSSAASGSAAVLVGTPGVAGGATATASATVLGSGKILAIVGGFVAAALTAGGITIAAAQSAPPVAPVTTASAGQTPMPDAAGEDAALGAAAAPSAAAAVVGRDADLPPWQQPEGVDTPAATGQAWADLTIDCDGCVFGSGSVVLSGMASPDADVTLVLSSDTMAPRIVQTVAHPDGVWSVRPGPITDDTYQVVAYQYAAVADRNGWTSHSFSVDTSVAVATPVITDVDTADGRYFPVVSGTGTAGYQVIVRVNGAVATAPVAADGRWTLIADSGARAGTNELVAQLSDPVSRASGAFTEPQSFELRTPVVSIEGWNVSVEFDPGASVTLWDPQGTLVHRITNARGEGGVSLSGRTTGLMLDACYASEDGTRFGPTVTAG
ncbi:hypothetical protein GCM10022198_26070 [Klugiella xanthotipulae]|uniref:RNA polymerase sigma factor (Sigma-70 family) n=1 Tax=Klugiella xanthotipulae TaxID=244735 RepID=A0A543I5P9_9MICO|nr:sigma-70 family RNA polymerase sigma factor [Klugiella xanthotipulae]TQM65908.1 RNA polymerase sigma factor (sigma-70 family) [Klugiella xanthotipulae]